MAVDLASPECYGAVVITAFMMAFEYFLIMEVTCNINRKRHFSK